MPEVFRKEGYVFFFYGIRLQPARIIIKSGVSTT